MEMLSALVEAGTLPPELLQQMFITDSVTTAKEQQVIHHVLKIRIKKSAIMYLLSCIVN